MANFDLNKYKNGGWGLSLAALKDLHNEILQKPNANILEFGSGFSTRMMRDMKYHYNLNIHITSYDHDPQYAFKPDEKDKSFLDVNIAKLFCVSDNEFNKIFEEKKIHFEWFKITPTAWVRNCFYIIKDEDLKKKYDIIMSDGPHGTGRAFTWLVFKDCIQPGTFILIDDSNFSYNGGTFEKWLYRIFECEKLKKTIHPEAHQSAHEIYRVKGIA